MSILFGPYPQGAGESGSVLGIGGEACPVGHDKGQNVLRSEGAGRQDRADRGIESAGEPKDPVREAELASAHRG